MTRIATGTLAVSIGLLGCATVRQVDLDAWVGQPVVALETHPVFITVPVVKTVASDGTQIWNYVNGAHIGQCAGGGSVWGSTINYAAYSQFASCMQRFAACNNIFYIRDGKVLRYTPVGTGGGRCYTTEALQPQSRGPTNIR
ncbi:MAG: hypothetical protein LKCHEGNO_01715 [Burkholderiaceae bacterium]|nr:hypothetical protein [Burkholderiaceae bacterium]